MSKTKPKKVYISGPITGKDYKEVLAAFHKGEKAMRNIGLRTVNPTTWWGRWHWIFEKLPYGLQLFICMCYLHGCQEILFLPGWTESRGAKLEKAFADFWKIKRHEMKKHRKEKRAEKQIVKPDVFVTSDTGKAMANLGKAISDLSLTADQVKEHMYCAASPESETAKTARKKRKKHRRRTTPNTPTPPENTNNTQK